MAGRFRGGETTNTVYTVHELYVVTHQIDCLHYIQQSCLHWKFSLRWLSVDGRLVYVDDLDMTLLMSCVELNEG